MSNDELNDATDGSLSRRSLAKAAAWGAPAVVMMGAAPECQASVAPGSLACASGPFYIDRRPVGGRADLDEGSFHFISGQFDLPKIRWVVSYVPVLNDKNELVKTEREIRAEEHKYGSNQVEMKLSGGLRSPSYNPGTGIVTLEFFSEPVKKRPSPNGKTSYTTGFKIFNAGGRGGRADKVVFVGYDAATGEELVRYDTVGNASSDKRWRDGKSRDENRQLGWDPMQDGRV